MPRLQNQGQIGPLGHHWWSYDKVKGLALVNRAEQHRKNGKCNAAQHKRKHDGAVIIIFGEPAYAQISHAPSVSRLAMPIRWLFTSKAWLDILGTKIRHSPTKPTVMAVHAAEFNRCPNQNEEINAKNGIRLLISNRLRQPNGSDPIEKKYSAMVPIKPLNKSSHGLPPCCCGGLEYSQYNTNTTPITLRNKTKCTEA